MPLLLSHNSSLECLRAIPPQARVLRRLDSQLSMQEVIPARGELHSLEPEQLGISQRPIHHLIPSTVRRSEVSGIKSHHCGMELVPKALTYQLGPDIYVCGPELTFIQMAATTSLIGAVVLGHELCGTYAHLARFVSGFYERPALTSVAKLKSAIESLDDQGMHGLRPAREALRWVRDGSASPMETVVSCMLHLPTKEGGFGLVAPELNCKEKLDDVARRIAGKKECRVDTGYRFALKGIPFKKGLEFDGKDYHRDAEADRIRREALAHMGWTIYVIDVSDMTSYQRIKDKVSLLGDVPRQRQSGEIDEGKGRELLERLLRATRFGVGLDPVLFGVNLPKGKVKVHL